MVVNNEYTPHPKGTCSFFIEGAADLANVPSCPCGSVVIDLNTGDMYVCFPAYWHKWGTEETVVK